MRSPRYLRDTCTRWHKSGHNTTSGLLHAAWSHLIETGLSASSSGKLVSTGARRSGKSENFRAWAPGERGSSRRWIYIDKSEQVSDHLAKYSQREDFTRRQAEGDSGNARSRDENRRGQRKPAPETMKYGGKRWWKNTHNRRVLF